MNSNLSENNHGPKVRRIKGRRSRLYIFSITALCVFLLVAVVWPLRVREFKSTSMVEFQVDKSLALDKSNLKGSLLNALSRLTQDDRFSEAVEFVGQETNISSPLFSGSNRDKIQDHLKVKLHSTDDPTKVQLSLELTGKGSQDEIEMVNHFASMMITEFSQETTRFTANLRQASVKNQLEQLISQVRLENHNILKQLRTDCERIANQVDRAIEIDKQNELARNARTENPSLANSNTNQLKKQELAMLKSNYGRVLTSNAPDRQIKLETIQRRITSLEYEIGQATSTIKNTFLASSTKPASTISVSDHLKTLDVDETLMTVERLAQSLETANIQKREILKKIDSLDGINDDESAPVILTDRRLASSSQPVGGVPSLGQLFLLVVSSLMMAAAITAVFNPAASYQPFASNDQITERTGLPVVATLQSANKQKSTTVPPLGQRLLLFFIRGCEVFLVVAALLLVFSIMLKSGFVPTMIENPFHAAAKMFTV